MKHLLLVLLLLLPTTAFAQAAPDIVISLRDADDAPVPNVQIFVRDAGGVRDLARATTDGAGQAIVSGLPVSEVRVAIAGALPNGMPLVQVGDDALGVLVFLDAATTRLDLRSEADGTIIPDPATMIAPDVAASDAARLFPTAPLAQAAAIPPAVAAPSADPAQQLQHPALTREAAAASKQRPPFPLAGIALVAALLAGIAGVIAWGRRI